MADEVHAGGCLCGGVRYAAAGKPKWVAYCHCQSCRRATGAPVTAYAGFRSDAVAWTTGGPTRFTSSPGVTRTFCGRCGTPLTYQGERWPGEIHIHLGTLDEPDRLPPNGQGFEAERLPWVRLAGMD